MCKLMLGSYRTTDIPASYLTSLQARLDAVRAVGSKCIIWGSYADNMPASDATAAQMVKHLGQLAPVFKANADVIPYLVGFVGAWGEWHSSLSGNTCTGDNSAGTSCATAWANQLLIRDAMTSAVAPTTIVQHRYPADMMRWYPTALSSTNAFDGSVQSRTGFKNDCQLSGSGDTGTWTNASAQQSYLDQATNYAPYGGETAINCATPHRTSCSETLADWSRWHLTWFKGPPESAQLVEWISAWTSGGCKNEIYNKMGYRFQIDQVTHQSSAAKGTSFSVNVDMRNVGLSRLFSARSLVVTLRNQSTGALITAKAGDLRLLAPQATASSRITVNVTVPSTAAAGTYDVYLSAPDIFSTTAADARYAIRFANVDNASAGQSWDSTNARYKTGTTVTVN
jgi:hypothetical protein